MKKQMLWLAGLGLGTVCHAGGMASQFEYSQPIQAEFEAGHVGRVRVSGEIFSGSRSFPNDLRILDSNGIQWPYYLSVAKEQTKSVELAAEIVNASFVDGPERYWKFDLVLPVKKGTPPVHNQLELFSSGSDYVRRVEVFTADEVRGQVATGYLIHFSNHRSAGSRTIVYPASDAGRLHLRVYANAKNAGEKFSIRSAKIRHRSTIAAEREPVAFQSLDVAGRDAQQGAQSVLLDIGYENRPVNVVSFNIETPSFVRSVTVLGRNRPDEPWQRIGGGGIHRFGEASKTELKLNGRKRFLKMDIYHHDDTPLALESIQLEAIPYYLVFEATSAGSAALCFRAWDVNAPRYDLKSRISTETAAAAPVYPTGETRSNELAKEHPWRKYSRVLAAVAVGAVSLLVIWVIVGMLKQQTDAS